MPISIHMVQGSVYVVPTYTLPCNIPTTYIPTTFVRT